MTLDVTHLELVRRALPQVLQCHAFAIKNAAELGQVDADQELLLGEGVSKLLAHERL